MKVSVQDLNKLPVQTWRWLGVNGTFFEGDVPPIEPLKNIPQPQLPSGVVPLETVPDTLKNIKTAVGKQAVQFVEQYANTGFRLHAKGVSDVAIPYVYDVSEQPVVENNFILAEENSEMMVLVSILSQEDMVCFHAACTRIYAKKGSRVRLIQVQRLNEHSGHWNDVGVYEEEGAHVEVIHVELGADRVLGGCVAQLAGETSHFAVETIYLGMKDNSLDFNYIAEHIAPKTTSDIKANGALLDNSQKVYRGTIDFKRGASYSVGHEKEHTLLFSPHTINRTSPLILCQEENVEGQHAASIGRIDEKKLFYLQSRGLSEVDAKKLLIEATFLPTIQKIPDETLQEQLFTYLTERIVVV